MPKQPSVRILLGPARSRKAAVLRQRYHDLLAAGADPARLLYLVPTRQRRTATLDRLLAESPNGVLRQPEVWTFPRFAENILRRLGTPARRISSLQQRLILADVLQSCRRNKSLRYFLPIADRPGLLDSIADFVHKLKTNEIRPDDFSRAARAARGSDPALTDMAAIYDRYQKQLAAMNLYDDAGLFWQAREALASAGAEFAWPEHVLVDGFQDFTPPQRDVLHALGAHGAEVLVTLTCDAARPAIFSPVLRTLENLKKCFGPRAAIEESGRDAAATASPLAFVEQHLFDLDAPAMPHDPGASISFAEAAGRTREVEYLARRVKRVLRENTNLSPRDIAIILRCGPPYEDLVAEIFPRYGLPLAGPSGGSLLRVPLARWLLELLRLPLADFNYADLAAVLRSPYFPRKCFAARDADLQMADRLLHRLNVFAGAANHLRAIQAFIASEAERAAASADDPGDGDRAASTVDLDQARGAERLLKRFFDWFASVPDEAKRSVFVNLVAKASDDFRLTRLAAQGDDLKVVRQDLAALEAIGDCLNQLLALGEMVAEVPLPVADFVAEFEEALRSATVSEQPPFGGAIQVLDVWSSRALSFPVVVMPGLSEGHWPLPYAENLLETSDHREDVTRAGLQVPTHAEQLAQERFLFYMAVTRASERLILTRPASDEDGRPIAASQFWDELRRLCSAKAERPACEKVSVRDCELPESEATSLEEVRRLAFSAAAGRGEKGENGEKSLALLAVLTGLDPSLASILAAAAVELERESDRPFGPFDGVLADGRNLAALADYPHERALSASRLETYAQCPFWFFAESLLRLEAWEPPEEFFLEDQVGILYHEILRAFYTRRRAAGPDGTRLELPPIEQLRKELAAEVDGAFRRQERDLGGLLPALWEIQKEEIHDRLLAWLDEERARCNQDGLVVQPQFFEWGFGCARRGDADPASTAQPLVMASSAGALKIRGRVDRIDYLLRDRDVESFAVIDYKSGSKPGNTARLLDEGLLLQPALYLLAVQQLLAPEKNIRPGQAIYWYLRSLEPWIALNFLGRDDKKAAQSAARLEAARSKVGEIVAQCRRGYFPPLAAVDCPSYCPYRDLCRMAEWRIEAKMPSRGAATEPAEPGQTEER